MAIGENGICVRILEKEFRIACAEHQETALVEAARHLDAQMRQIRKTGRVIGIERIAVMAALNIANELLTLKNATAAAVPPEALSSRLKMLQEKIEGVLAPAQKVSARQGLDASEAETGRETALELALETEQETAEQII